MISADFVKIENLLLKLLASVDKTFNQKELREVQDFIDVGEYGLALETFMYISIEEDKKLTLIDLGLIKELVATMKMGYEAFNQGANQGQSPLSLAETWEMPK